MPARRISSVCRWWMTTAQSWTIVSSWIQSYGSSARIARVSITCEGQPQCAAVLWHSHQPGKQLRRQDRCARLLPLDVSEARRAKAVALNDEMPTREEINDEC
jgi:hypothetical protein